MSGAEAGLVLGLLSATIAIFQAANDVYDAAHDATGLPKKFRVAAGEIPFVLETLREAQHDLGAGSVSEEAAKSAKPILGNCKASAEALKKIFDDTLPSATDSQAKRVMKASTVKLKSGKVMECMQQIARGLELLAQHLIFHNAKLSEDIKAAVERLDDADGEDRSRAVHYGSGDNILQSGQGTINNNKRSYINHGSGNVADTMNFGDQGAKRF